MHPNITGKSILVTGGAGFIGRHLTQRLSEKNQPIVIDDLSVGDSSSLPAEVRLIVEDVTDRNWISNSITDVDIILHQAGLVSVSQSIQSPYESHNINATGTLNILDAARKYNARVVVASSAAIYGHPEYTPIDEGHPFDPTSPYGLDKLTADYYARLYNDLYDLQTVTLRYFNVFGPGQTGGDYAGVIPIFIKQALSGEDITVHGDGRQTRDFVYVDDIVDANIAAAQTDSVGEAYNIGTGESVSIWKLAELIRDLTGTDSDIVHLDSRPGDIENSVADVSKAKADLGYEPSISLESGLERTIEWWKTTKTDR